MQETASRYFLSPPPPPFFFFHLFFSFFFFLFFSPPPPPSFYIFNLFYSIIVDLVFNPAPAPAPCAPRHDSCLSLDTSFRPRGVSTGAPQKHSIFFERNLICEPIIQATTTCTRSHLSFLASYWSIYLQPVADNRFVHNKGTPLIITNKICLHN